MTPELLQLVAQLGVGGIIFWLLLEERKARQALEERIFRYLDQRLAEQRAQLEQELKP